MLTKHATLLLVFVFVGSVYSQTKVGDSCLEKNANVMGTCTPVRQCNSARNDYIQKKQQPTLCVFSYNNPIVCCRDRRPQAAPPRVIKSPPTVPKDTRRVSERKCSEYSRSVTQKKGYQSLLPIPDTYTISSPNCTYNNVELIVGGEAAIRGQFPHMVAIGWLDFEGGYVYNCGGSLISSRFVLTAGHCAWDPQAREFEPSVVRLGEHNLDHDIDDGANPINVAIKKIHQHPGYKPPILYNDIALLELDSEVKFSTWIRPACLWNRFGFGDHEKAIATGWGINDTTKETRVPELQRVSLSLLENDYCDPLLVKHRNWQGFRDTQLCAGELRGKKDTCKGDSGSPLQVTSNDNKCIFHVMGIVSFGSRCANGRPAVYTRVFEFLSWIESVVWPGE